MYSFRRSLSLRWYTVFRACSAALHFFGLYKGAAGDADELVDIVRGC